METLQRFSYFSQGKKINTLYKTEARLVKGDVNVVENETSTELWHKRLGHMSEKGLQVLAKKQLLPNIKGTSLMPCTHCLVGKQIRVSFINPHNQERLIFLI